MPASPLQLPTAAEPGPGGVFSCPHAFASSASAAGAGPLQWRRRTAAARAGPHTEEDHDGGSSTSSSSSLPRLSRLSVGVGPVNANIAKIRKHLGTLRRRYISIWQLVLLAGLMQAVRTCVHACMHVYFQVYSPACCWHARMRNLAHASIHVHAQCMYVHRLRGRSLCTAPYAGAAALRQPHAGRADVRRALRLGIRQPGRRALRAHIHLHMHMYMHMLMHIYIAPLAPKVGTIQAPEAALPSLAPEAATARTRDCSRLHL